MPAAWISAGVGAVGLANSLFGGGQSGQGGQANPYAVQSAGQQYDIANTVSGLAQPAYLQRHQFRPVPAGRESSRATVRPDGPASCRSSAKPLRRRKPDL